jgi:hypothetical protein
MAVDDAKMAEVIPGVVLLLAGRLEGALLGSLLVLVADPDPDDAVPI